MRRKKRQAEADKETSDRWLLTYADLITLLMIFFVVLYSMSKVDSDKFQAMAESLSKSLGGGTPAKMTIADTLSGPTIITTGKQNTTTEGEQLPKNLSQEQANQGQQGNSDQENLAILGVKAKLDKFAADNGLETKIVSSVSERGLVISIQDTVLFDSGSAVVTPYAHQILNKISVVIGAIPNHIKVEGHTDNMPINTPQFKSNWELSVIRATNVSHILIDEGSINPNSLSVTGYGEYRPVTTNETELGRTRNRRVDLVILRSKYDITEPQLSGQR